MTIEWKKGLNGLREIALKVRGATAEELRNAADDIVDYAQAVVPYKTGHLHDSIHVEELDEMSLQVRADAHYAAYVEFGTPRMDAQPYMTPAIEAVWPSVVRTIADRVGRGR